AGWASVGGRQKRWIRVTPGSCRPPGGAFTSQGAIRPRTPPRILGRLFVVVEELRVEPTPGEEPPAFGRAEGDAQSLGGFRQGQAAEVPQGDELGLLWIEGDEAIDRLVQCQDLLGRLRRVVPVGQLDALPVAAAFVRAPGASVIDQDATHGLGGCREEVSLAGEVWSLALTDEPQVSLVNQGGRLERLAGRLVGQLRGG